MKYIILSSVVLLASPALSDTTCDKGWTMVVRAEELSALWNDNSSTAVHYYCAKELKEPTPIAVTVSCALPDGRHWVSKHGYCSAEDAP
jgi:hypothetical protein